MTMRFVTIASSCGNAMTRQSLNSQWVMSVSDHTSAIYHARHCTVEGSGFAAVCALIMTRGQANEIQLIPQCRPATRAVK